MTARILATAALLALFMPGAHSWVSPMALLGPVSHFDDLPLRSPALRQTLLDAPSLLRDADRSLATLDKLFDQMLPADDLDGLFPSLRSPLKELMVEGFGGDGRMQLSPAFEFQEIGDGVLLTAATPGLKKEDLTVEVVNKERRGNYLVVSGHSKKEEGTPALKENKDEKKGQKSDNDKADKPAEIQAFKSSEYRFERSVRLPNTIDPGSITSKYEDGMLQVHLKYQDKPKVERKRIDIS